MNGLDLESFLRLLRADLAAWLSLAAILIVLALMTWTSWGSRRALRKCLVLSIAVHLGLVAFGGPIPARLFAARLGSTPEPREHIREIRVTPRVEGTGDASSRTPDGRPGRRLADWDRPEKALAPADPRLDTPRPRPEEVVPGPIRREQPDLAIPPPEAAPEVAAPEPPRPDPRPSDSPKEADSAPVPVAAADPSEIAGGPVEVEVPTVASVVPEVNIRQRTRLQSSPSPPVEPPRRPRGPEPPAIARGTPSNPSGFAEMPMPSGPRSRVEVPEVYRPRLDPNKSALARKAGASDASEQAVERALDWLNRHQDLDGRWNGGTAKDRDNSPKKGEENFTIHCSTGDICSGECLYYDADTAMTGLALLAYLGAGYTHTSGKYAPTVGRGLQFLLLTQRPDGDLRGEARGVGMYCHAMASLALCEAYALTRDPRLRDPVTRAVGYLAKARATDGRSWRYEPRAKSGDTSLLGWAIMVFKSAKVSGIDIPADVPAGALAWLRSVADGTDEGLARYRPFEDNSAVPQKPTATMTAEAWVIRQFLGAGGPGPASAEAARYLLDHGPDREPFNLYYWYYATLAMYQNGGAPWIRWNSLVRDDLVHRQRLVGHAAGSWDPDTDKYGGSGGRIYSTAMATMTLEVYYRYLRLYDAPAEPPAPLAEPGDGAVRRAGGP